MEGGKLADDGPGQGTGPFGWAGERDDAERTQRDRDRGVGEPGRAADESAGGLEELRVVVGERVGSAVEPHRSGERDRAAADADGEEVVVAGAALPQAVGPDDPRPQLGRVGMEVLGGGELDRGQLVGADRARWAR